MPKYKDFQEVPAWQLAHQAVLKVYKVTSKFPKEEIYGLVSQIRRSASSIPANIAEGFYRNTTKELIKFLFYARGSCGETLYHIILAHDLGYINKSEFKDLKKTYDVLARQLNGWINSLKQKLN